MCIERVGIGRAILGNFDTFKQVKELIEISQ